jgi:hypothetical protein
LRADARIEHFHQLPQEFELVERCQIQFDDVVDQLLQRRISLVAYVIPHRLDLIQLRLQKLDNISRFLGRLQSDPSDQPMPTLIRLGKVINQFNNFFVIVKYMWLS